jgi:hypothetical protein
MPLDLPLSALRKHAKDPIVDVDAFLEQVLATPDEKPAPRGEDEGGAQASLRP